MKRPFSLLELLIALALTGMMVAVLFQWMKSNAHIHQAVQKEQEMILEREKLQARLESLFFSTSKLYTTHEKEKELLIVLFDAGIDPDPVFSGPQKGEVELTKEGDLVLMYGLEHKRGEVLYKGLKKLEWQFLDETQKNKNLWSKDWSQNQELTSIVRLILWPQKGEEELKFAFILPHQGAIRLR